MALLWMVPMLIDWLASLDTKRDLANDGALFWIGIVLIFAFVSRLFRSESLLRIEIIKKRFEPLQLLPIAAARRAWLWCAPVTLPSLLLCALAVPALIWGLTRGLFSFSDALGLTLLSLMLSWGRPLWRPQMWRGQLDKNAANARNGSDGFRAPLALSADLTLWLGSLFLVGAAVIIAGVRLEPLLAYIEGWPVALSATGAELWMTWPLFLARWLMRAQPFFAFGLAPVFLVLPLWLAHIHNGVLRLGAVTALEPYWTAGRLQRWRGAQSVQRLTLALLVFGLLWPGSIESAWMSLWFRDIAASRESALAVWWIVALATATLGATALWGGALNDATASLPTLIKRAARAATRGVALALAIFAGTHLLGLAWPFGALWQQIAPASLAVALVFFGAYAATWAGMKMPALRPAFELWNRVWLYGGLAFYVVFDVCNINAAAWQPIPSLLSPWTLWFTLRDAAIGESPAFWIAIALHGSLVALSGLAVWRARNTAIEAPQPRHSQAPDVELLKTAIANLSRSWDTSETATIAIEPVRDEPAAAATPNADARAIINRPLLEEPRRYLTKLLDWQERFDNPLLQLETRRVVGNAISNTIDIATLANTVGALILLVLLPVIGMSNGAYPFAYLTGASCLILLVWFVVPLLGIEGAARAYDADRLDGSLAALFLTPRTEKEIAVGKIGPFVVRGALMLLLFAPLWLLGLGFCVLAREPLLTAAFVAMPFFTATFALRCAALSHWIALAKRRIGPGGTPSSVTLGAIVAVPTEAGALIWGATTGAPALFGVAIMLALLFAVEAFWFWRLGLRALRRWRAREVPVGL